MDIRFIYFFVYVIYKNKKSNIHFIKIINILKEAKLS